MKNMTTPAELKTLRDFLRWAVSRFTEAAIFYGHGTNNAWDEALALILPTLHLPHDIDRTVLDARLTSLECDTICHLIHRRVQERIPVAYLTHEAWFAGDAFYVDERVLIPRSPFAELIENAFQPWIETEKIHTILDLCTGSGCIAIATAKAFPDAHVDASDISADALAVAKINVLRHHVEDQVTLHVSNLFLNLPPKKYDLILSNPPYVSSSEMTELPKEYHHEPSKGLLAGSDGLDSVLPILQQAKNYLSENGSLIVEVGNSEIVLAEKFPHIPFTWLEFQRGSGGIFLLTAKQLQNSIQMLNKLPIL